MDQSCVSLKFVPCGTPEQGRIALLTLSRQESGNAFDAEMVAHLSGCLETLSADPLCRVVVLQGKGRNFCTGARLDWMQEQGNLPFAENIAAAQTMAKMFRLLAAVPCPTIGVATGAVYGGGVGLIACCDMVLAADDSRFCLSEVKIGLLPAVILPYLQRKIMPGQLKRIAMSGRIFSAAQALQYGLVEELCPADELNMRLEEMINHLLAAAPEAQRRLKLLMDGELVRQVTAQEAALTKAIAEARSGREGHAGLSAFMHKQSPPWAITLATKWKN